MRSGQAQRPGRWAITMVSRDLRRPQGHGPAGDGCAGGLDPACLCREGRRGIADSHATADIGRVERDGQSSCTGISTRLRYLGSWLFRHHARYGRAGRGGTQVPGWLGEASASVPDRHVGHPDAQRGQTSDGPIGSIHGSRSASRRRLRLPARRLSAGHHGTFVRVPLVGGVHRAGNGGGYARLVEFADVVKVLAGIIGGGVGKTLLDYVFTDRRDRRVRLRPKDEERIEKVRAGAEEEYLSTARILLDLPQSDSPEKTFADRALGELNDVRLEQAWHSFVNHSRQAQLDNRKAEFEHRELPFEMRYGVYKELSALYQDVVNSLNRIERHR